MSKQLNSLELSATSPQVLRWVKRLTIIFFIIPFIFLFFPWQQNVSALGKVTAFSPNDRAQTVDSPVSGVISKWNVQEGSKVKAGDVLLEIRDIDPQFKDRLMSQRDNLLTKLESKKEELKAYELQQNNLVSARDAKISAAQFKLDMANQKILSASEAMNSAQATLEAANFQATRLQRLLQDGLVSKRDVEVAERDQIIANRNLNSAQAQLLSAKAEAKSASAEIQQIRADTQATIESNNASINKIKGELAESEVSLTSAEINVSRQRMQRVTAPRDGTVYRLPVNTESQVISQGTPLLTILPDTQARAVELWVDGRDAPLIKTGSEVRLEFEGWPAILIPGWANIGFGTFPGKVAFVDPVDNGTGNFRVMILPPDGDKGWPSSKFLRQGINAKGWILLNDVTIGYEIWRILNGFPPRIPQETVPIDSVPLK